MKYIKSIVIGMLAVILTMQMPIFAEEVTSEEVDSVISEVNGVNSPRANTELVEPKPVVVTEDKSARIGETISHHMSGLDMEAPADNLIQDLQFGFFSEYYMKDTQFESIEFPYITAKDVNGDPVDNVAIYFMVIYDKGRGWIKDPVSINVNNPSAGITRAEVQAWADKENNGEFPERLYYLIQPENDANPLRNVDATEIKLHGDIVLTQRLVNEATYKADSYYEYLQWDVSWVFEKDFNQQGSNGYKKTTGYQYIFPETSTVTFDTPNLEDMQPGDEFTIDFTLTNDALQGNRLSLLLKTEGLEMIDGQDNEKIIWYDDVLGFRGRLITTDGKWHLLQQGSPITVSQRFRIKDDFTGNQIKINAGLTASSVGHDYEFDNEFVLTMRGPVVSSYNVIFESNGGSNVANYTGITSGATIVTPTEPTLEGFTFGGWYLDDGTFAQAWNFANDTVVANVTLYAKWDAVVVPNPTNPIVPMLPTTGLSNNSILIGGSLTAVGLLVLLINKKRSLEK